MLCCVMCFFKVINMWAICFFYDIIALRLLCQINLTLMTSRRVHWTGKICSIFSKVHLLQCEAFLGLCSFKTDAAGHWYRCILFFPSTTSFKLSSSLRLFAHFSSAGMAFWLCIVKTMASSGGFGHASHTCYLPALCLCIVFGLTDDKIVGI